MPLFTPLPAPNTSYVIQSQDTYLNATVPMAVVGGGGGGGNVNLNVNNTVSWTPVNVSTLGLQQLVGFQTSVLESQTTGVLTTTKSDDTNYGGINAGYFGVVYDPGTTLDVFGVLGNTTGAPGNLELITYNNTTRVSKGGEIHLFGDTTASTINVSTINGVSFQYILSTLQGLSPP